MAIKTVKGYRLVRWAKTRSIPACIFAKHDNYFKNLYLRLFRGYRVHETLFFGYVLRKDFKLKIKSNGE